LSEQNIEAGLPVSSSKDCCFASYDVPLAVALDLKISAYHYITYNSYVLVQGIFTQIVFYITVISSGLYSSPSIIRMIKSRRMGWAGHVAQMGLKRNAYRILVGKLEGKRSLGRPRRR
jgi:hypothetical protein